MIPNSDYLILGDVHESFRLYNYDHKNKKLKVIAADLAVRSLAKSKFIGNYLQLLLPLYLTALINNFSLYFKS